MALHIVGPSSHWGNHLTAIDRMATKEMKILKLWQSREVNNLDGTQGIHIIFSSIEGILSFSIESMGCITQCSLLVDKRLLARV